MAAARAISVTRDSPPPARASCLPFFAMRAISWLIWGAAAVAVCPPCPPVVLAPRGERLTDWAAKPWARWSRRWLREVLPPPSSFSTISSTPRGVTKMSIKMGNIQERSSCFDFWSICMVKPPSRVKSGEKHYDSLSYLREREK